MPNRHHPSLERFEAALRHAAKDFTARLFAGAAEDRPLSPALILSLGLDLPAAALGAGPSSLAPADRRLLAERLRLEDRRLLRMARGARPGYDLTRHLALRRILARIETGVEAAGRPLSGAECNRRFSRRGRVRQPARASLGT